MTHLDSMTLVDEARDQLEVEDYGTFVAITAECEVHLDTTGAENLHRWLGEWLGDTSSDCAEDRPEAKADGYEWPTLPPSCGAPGHESCTEQVGQLIGTPPESTVAGEAHAAVYGDRQADYGHPREDFTRTAVLWTGLLQHKLAEGEFIEAEDIARCLIGVKLARDVHSPKRDNRVDMAGYAITLDRLETGH